MVRGRAQEKRTESQARRDLRGRFALAAVGAPVGAPRRNPPPADLEATLADGLVLAHRDATLARTLPLVFWRQRDSFDLDRLVAQASRRGERFALGLFLELAGRLGHEPSLVQAARRLRDRRRTTVRPFFTRPEGPFLMALTRRYTPRAARRWGYLMNMTVDSFRTLSLSGPSLRQPQRLLVSSEPDTPDGCCAGEDDVVRAPLPERRIVEDSNHVPATITERLDQGGRRVLVREQRKATRHYWPGRCFDFSVPSRSNSSACRSSSAKSASTSSLWSA